MKQLFEDNIDHEKALKLLKEYKENIFATEFISDEEAEVLYTTIMDWKDSADMFKEL